MMQIWFRSAGEFIPAMRKTICQNLLPELVLLNCLLLITGCERRTAGTSAIAAFAVQVIAIEAKRQPVSETLTLPGTIAANEQVEVKAETDGVVQEINFAEGERVAKGQLLVKLDDTK